MNDVERRGRPRILLLQDLGQDAAARAREILREDEVSAKLEAMFESLDSEELAAFQKTGRMSVAGAEAFAAAIMRGMEVDDPVLGSLLEEMAADRFIPILTETGVARGSACRDLPQLATSLADRLHIASTGDSVIERLGLRDTIRQSMPGVRIHELPGRSGVQGWWDHPADYAQLLASVASDHR